VVNFVKGWSNIENVNARTIHADGTIVPFDGKVYDKEVLKAHGIKIHVKSFSLADVQLGSIIEYRYYFRYADQYFVAPQWVVQGELWQKTVHFKYLPADTYSHEIVNSHQQIIHGVSWTSLCPKELQPKLITMPSGQEYVELNGGNVPPFVEEPYMVTSNQFKFNIHFYYVTSTKQEDFWKQEGKWWSKDAEKFMNKKDGVAEEVNQLVAASDTPEQKVQKIYGFVGGLENQTYGAHRTVQERLAMGMKDQGVSDILKQKSGDRDDLTRLFVAMARAADIPAHLMIVTSRENNYFEPAYLNADQLDWEIAIVTLNGKEVFLDPGTKFCPYGMLYWELNATGGLRETDKGTAIAQTPGPTYMEAITQRIGRFVMNDDGTIEGNMKAVFMGQEALTRRQAALKTDAEGRKKELEDEIKGWLPAGAEVKLVSNPAWEATSDEFTATFHVQTTLAASAGKRVLLPLHVFQFNEKPKFPSPERSNGVYLYYPSRELDDVSVTLPAALEIETLPQNESARVDYAVYKSNWQQQQRTVTATRDLAMAGFVFAPNEYKDLKGFYDKVKAGDEQQAILKVSANAAGK
jgi:hypothetical protein